MITFLLCFIFVLVGGTPFAVIGYFVGKRRRGTPMNVVVLSDQGTPDTITAVFLSTQGVPEYMAANPTASLKTASLYIHD